jgi:hypothetical protein
VSRPPTLPEEFYTRAATTYAVPPDRVNLGYVGDVDPDRDLREVLAALGRLEEAERDRLLLHVVTSEPEQVRARLDALGLGGLPVALCPPVPYLESLRLIRMMDVLLVADTRTPAGFACNPRLPSRWSDHIGSGRDIWAVVEAGSAISGMPVPYRSGIGDVDGALAQLRRVLAEHVAR